jgi:hypothetical protein
MTLPDIAHRGDGVGYPGESKLVGDPDIAIRGIALRHLQDLGLDLGGCLVGHLGLSAFRGRQTFPAIGLIGLLDLIVVTAGYAGHLAGFGNVVQFFHQG